MSPQDALNLLNNATAMVETNRQGHVNIQQAIQTLTQFVILHKDCKGGPVPKDEASTPENENPGAEGDKDKAPKKRK